jgi:hydrogenase maturation factor HypF (carbamoyltransferase family)
MLKLEIIIDNEATIKLNGESVLNSSYAGNLYPLDVLKIIKQELEFLHQENPENQAVKDLLQNFSSLKVSY